MLCFQSMPFEDVITLLPEKERDIATNKFKTDAYITTTQLPEGAVCETQLDTACNPYSFALHAARRLRFDP